MVNFAQTGNKGRLPRCASATATAQREAPASRPRAIDPLEFCTDPQRNPETADANILKGAVPHVSLPAKGPQVPALD
jgi:hypothetical protein